MRAHQHERTLPVLNPAIRPRQKSRFLRGKQQLRFLFRSLRSPAYRRYFVANGISLIGTWTQRLAMSWLVYRLTDSPVALGVVTFAQHFSSFMLMPWAGTLLDSLPLRPTIIITQALSLLQALLLAALTMTEAIGYSHLVVLSVVLGCINAFGLPGRQAFVIHLVQRKRDLGNAIALNSTVFNAARLLGPAFAGVIVAAFGEGICFLLNSLSFLPIILVLLRVREKPVERKSSPQAIFQGTWEGIAYARRHPVIGPILLLLALSSFMGMSYMVLMPVFAKEILGGGPETLGYLLGAMGCGALAGALYLASRTYDQRLERTIPWAFAGFGGGLIAFSLSTSLPLSLAIMVFAGFCMVSGWSTSNTVLQHEVDDNKRGRIVSLYLMCFNGMTPLGSLALGAMATSVGPVVTLMLSGGLCMTGSILYFRRRFLGPAEVRFR